jgi:hypothetical protein
MKITKKDVEKKFEAYRIYCLAKGLYSTYQDQVALQLWIDAIDFQKEYEDQIKEVGNDE